MSWYDEISKLIGQSLDYSKYQDAKSGKNTKADEAALVGASVARQRASALENRRAADIARRAGETAPEVAPEVAPEAGPAPTESLMTKGSNGSGGGSNALQIGEGTSGGNQLAQRGGGELANTKGELTEFEPREMRNVTPQPKGAGIGSVTSGAAVFNPVAATLGAFLASS